MAFFRGKSLREEEFRDLFEQYFEQIKRFLYYKTGDEEIASDIAQDVFLKLWEQRDSVREDTVEALLYTMANRMFINLWRKNKVALKFVRRAEEQPQDVLSPENLYAYKETKEIYENLLSGMTDECRTVFLMNRIDQMKYKEIAESLSISVKAVEKRMSKVLSVLRAGLVKYS